MTTFEQREKSFENKAALEEELKFRAQSRRNKKLAAWAMNKAGRPAADADAYFKLLTEAQLQGADKGVIEKILGDFQAANVALTAHQVEHKAQEYMAEAIEEVRAGR